MKLVLFSNDGETLGKLEIVENHNLEKKATALKVANDIRLMVEAAYASGKIPENERPIWMN